MLGVRIGVIAAMMATLAGPASADPAYYYRPTGGQSQPTQADDIPDPFSMPMVANVDPGVLVQSAKVFPTGFKGSVSVSVSGGNQAAISLDNGASWKTQVTIEPGKGFIARQLSSSTSSGFALAEVRVGHGSPVMWAVVTRGLDRVPDPFTIPPVTDAVPSSAVKSEPVFVDGFEGTVNVNASSNSKVSLDGLNWVDQAQIAPGQSFVVRMIAPPSFSTTAYTNVVVGSSGPVTFNVTTKAPDRPLDGLILGIINDAPVGQMMTSEALTFYFTDGPVSITASNGGQVSVAGGPWTSSTTLMTGQPFVIRLASSDDYNTKKTTTVRFGEGYGTFEVTTRSFP